MTIKIGIVGLPNVGKSTLFNAITTSQVEAANYPFATIKPNHSIVELKDQRLYDLAKLFNSKKIIFNQIEFVDIAGLVKGAHKGEGLGNKFLSNIREVNAIIHVVRLFNNPKIIHISSNWNPQQDIETINLELFLSDLEQLQTWLNKNQKRITASSDKTQQGQLKLMLALKEQFEHQVWFKKIANNFSLEELAFLKTFNFLTFKPMLFVGNIAEEEINNIEKNDLYQIFSHYLKNELKEEFVLISAQIEAEISKVTDPFEQQQFLSELNLSQSGLNLISQKIFTKLNLASYFTVGPEEAHAWAFRIGTTAKEGAGIIHTDFEKGFIKAEVYNYNDIIKYRSEQALKEKGLIRIEGKTYQLKDGDICHFRFNL